MMLAPGGGGGDGFQVVMSDLLDASTTFGTEAATYKAIMPDNGPACPDGGDGAFDQSLQVVVQLIGALHLQAAGVMENDSAKLKKAHDNYAHTEESLAQLCNQISSPLKIN
ncbi:MAG TPA: DUF6317 family protein [Streptosporangiaceae bacterium]|jgi:hypothetical protein|nr:DUF6317 family protein [Streptosporangiaceae bacterium]